VAAVLGGLWMARVGPRTVGLTAAALHGLGFGYIVPAAALVKWFPGKRAMITGIAVAGFGGGRSSPRRSRPG
jgi:OFA family oxalate/formate antiporter-like MFS transporter